MRDQRVRVLLIEDNSDDTLLIQEELAETEGAPFQLECVARLSDGLERLSRGGLDVVLLDLSLPDSQGLDTFNRTHDEAPNVPIIMLTGLDDERLAVQAVQMGAKDYLVKNQVDKPLLVHSLRYAIERHRLLEEVVVRTQQLSAINTELESEIAERKRAEEALAAKTIELERSNRELEQFAYIASHDLQEPLRMVDSYMQLLARRYKDQLDSDAQEFIDYAVDGATRMQTLINDLLAFSRVDTQGRSFEPASCNEIVDQVVSDLQVVIQECGAQVTREDLPEVTGDATQLAQLLQNLISNGIKFRGERAPEIHVSATRKGDSWVFSVRDNGIGIAPEHAERIFLMFQRLHHRTEYAGTGIGLALCQKIVNRHGGRIWVESTPGEGSTFCFTVPKMERGDDPR